MRTLVDTSVWIDHFRRGHPGLRHLLEEGAVLCHPFVIGELACGNLKRRTDVLQWLSSLPGASVAQHDEALELLERERLYGRGLGWIDVHLLASARLSSCTLWTLDVRLTGVAAELGLGES